MLPLPSGQWVFFRTFGSHVQGHTVKRCRFIRFVGTAALRYVQLYMEQFAVVLVTAFQRLAA